jgi:hypothetical protein
MTLMTPQHLQQMYRYHGGCQRGDVNNNQRHQAHSLAHLKVIHSSVSNTRA